MTVGDAISDAIRWFENNETYKDNLTKQPSSRMLKPDEALKLIGPVISRGSFYKAIKRNEIPSIRLGKRILIPEGAFTQWIKSADIETNVEQDSRWKVQQNLTTAFAILTGNWSKPVGEALNLNLLIEEQTK